MKKRIASAFLVLGLGTVAAVGWMAAQETPRPPKPPEPPPAFAAPPGPAVVAAPPQAPFPGIFLDGGAWLGLRLTDVTSEQARKLKLPGEYGAVVEEVEPDSPASKAGLAKEDVILEFGGERVWSVSQLQRIVRETPPGRTVELELSRDGKRRPVSVKLESREAGAMHLATIQLPGLEFSTRRFMRGSALGVSGEELTRQLADYFGVKQGKGVLVREVVAGSAAQKAGLKAGDVIIRVDNTDVGSVEELRRALPRDLTEKHKVNVTIVRDRREQTLTVELEPLHRVTPREAQLFSTFGIDQDELRRLTEEARQLAEEAARLKMYGYREKIEDARRAIRDWQKQWEQEQRQLQEELRLKLKGLARAENQTI